MPNPNQVTRRSTHTRNATSIRVDFISRDALGLPGRLGLTIAPGKKDARWNRDLDTDLRRLRQLYRTQLLVCLMEPRELEKLQIVALPESARRLGIDFATLPIRDVDVPAPSADAAVTQLVTRIVAALREGASVVIHCRGGLGRSGTIAAACLVALGRGAEAAIELVRDARPGAIETSEQEQWVRDYALCTAPGSLERFRGCLLAGAIGDALGAAVEFSSGDSILRRYGTAPPASLPDARFTDDTQMTLFTAEGLIASRLARTAMGSLGSLACVQRALLRWYRTQDPGAAGVELTGWLVNDRRMHERRAPGTTCLSSLRALGSGGVHSVASPPNHSKGCGAVMRSAPIGLVAASRVAAFELARDAGALTHGHPSGHLSAAYFAAVIWGLHHGEKLVAATAAADVLLANEPGREELRTILERADLLVRRGVPTRAAIEGLGGGWTGEEALAIALLCAKTLEGNDQHSVARCLWRAAAHGGDSDSTASIAGNLLGVQLGMDVVPRRWLEELEMRDIVDRIARDLYAASTDAGTLSVTDYPCR